MDGRGVLRMDGMSGRQWRDCLRRGECPACGAANAKEAETLCRPVGDSCVACDESLWDDSDAAMIKPDWHRKQHETKE